MIVITWSDLILLIALNAFEKNLYRTSNRGFGCHCFTEDEMCHYNNLICANGRDKIITGRVCLDEDGGTTGYMWIGLNDVCDMNGLSYSFIRDEQDMIHYWES